MEPRFITLTNGRLSAPVQRPRRTYRPDPALCALTRDWPMTGTGMPAGYTYLGQFLAHELVTGKDEDDSPIPRTPRLNLETLYGRDPESTFAGDTVDADGAFILGWTLAEDGSTPVSPRDLPRGANRRPRIPEPRNDENLIVAQLHSLFMRFHNWTLTRLRAHPDCHKVNTARLFKLARLHVISTLHHIVIKDFLASVSDPQVYNRIFRGYAEYIHFRDDDPLPPEFTAAAFRFGHAMVRENYVINFEDIACSTPRRLNMSEIFAMTGRGGLRRDPAQAQPGGAGIAETHAIDWHFFYAQPGDGSGVNLSTLFRIPLPGQRLQMHPNDSFRIDPAVIPIMGNLPNEQRDHSLILRNLNAGEEQALVSGQTLAAQLLERLGLPDTGNPLGLSSSLPLRQDHDLALKTRLLADAGFLDDTPLWLFVLVEASERHYGLCLGPLGSLIVCESFRAAIGRQIRCLDLAARQELAFLRAVLRPFSSMAELVNHIQGAPYEHPAY